MDLNNYRIDKESMDMFVNKINRESNLFPLSSRYSFVRNIRDENILITICNTEYAVNSNILDIIYDIAKENENVACFFATNRKIDAYSSFFKTISKNEIEQIENRLFLNDTIKDIEKMKDMLTFISKYRKLNTEKAIIVGFDISFCDYENEQEFEKIAYTLKKNCMDDKIIAFLSAYTKEKDIIADYISDVVLVVKDVGGSFICVKDNKNIYNEYPFIEYNLDL